MASSTVYNTGSASVVTGSPTVTGTGTGWFLALVTGGVFSLAGLAVPILEVTDDTTLTLAYNWPGDTLAAQPYAISRETSEGSRAVWTNDRLATIIQKLALVGIHPDGSGSLVERDALSPAPDTGFLWLRAEVGVDLEFYRKTGSGWDGPFDVRGDPGTGAPGADGSPGLIWIDDAWAPSIAYLIRNALEHNGSSYRAIANHTSTAGTEPGVGGSWQSVWTLVAAEGLPGGDGNDGNDGTDGTDPGVLLIWDTGTADADPGAGVVRANNASLASATFLYVSKTNKGGSDVAAFLLALAGSTNTTKGTITLTNPADDKQTLLSVVSVTDATGYVKVGVTDHSGETAYADAIAISFQFSRTGNVGASGAGTGDMLEAVYDPTNVSGDAFDMDNMVEGATNKILTAAERAKVGHLTVTQAVDLDAIETNSNASKVKTDFLTVTQAVDLDAIETRVNALDAAIVLKGTWDASAGTFPGGGTAQAGDSWIVSVGGTVNSQVFAVNDRIIAILDNASTTTFASNWFKADYTDLVTAVAGLTGAISAAALKTAIAIAVADITDASANGRSLMSAADYSAMRTLLGLVIGTNVQAYDANTAKLNVEDQTLSGGARVTIKDLGNLSGASITPDPGDRPTQKVTNNGAGSILPGSNFGTYRLLVINTTGAGVITTTGWTLKGDAFDTTTSSKFLCGAEVYNDMKVLTVMKVA
jgi:hypothetical protein